MPEAACTDAEFIALWQRTRGSPAAMEKILGIAVVNIYRRRRGIEKRLGERLLSHSANSPDKAIIGPENTFIRKNRTTVENGVVVVFTDAHFYPGVRSTAYRALLKLLPDLKPKAVIDNGDSVDGGQVSRHARIGWDKRPTMKEEIEDNVDRHAEIKDAAGTKDFWWNWGNHDLRPQTRLAEKVPEFEGLDGYRLEDYFPEWKFGISLTINPDSHTPTLVKHRYRGGDHADWNNVIRAGINIVTGHDHQMGVRRFVDKRGVRYGARAGTLSDLGIPVFDYQEDNPSQQQSGFMILRFWKSQLLCPQQVSVLDETHVDLWGEQVITV